MRFILALHPATLLLLLTASFAAPFNPATANWQKIYTGYPQVAGMRVSLL